jgi:hypothetical protein
MKPGFTISSRWTPTRAHYVENSALRATSLPRPAIGACPPRVATRNRHARPAITACGDRNKTETEKDWSLTMTSKLTAAVLLALSLTGTSAAFAQSAYDYYRYQQTGRGQCYNDEGYGRYSPCDSGH